MRNDETNSEQKRSRGLRDESSPGEGALEENRNQFGRKSVAVAGVVVTAAVIVVAAVEVAKSDRVEELWRDDSRLLNADSNESRSHQFHRMSDKESIGREKKEDGHHRNQRQLIGGFQLIVEGSGRLGPRRQCIGEENCRLAAHELEGKLFSFQIISEGFLNQII